MPNLGRADDLVDLVVHREDFMNTAILILEMEKCVRQNSYVLAQAAKTKYLTEQFKKQTFLTVLAAGKTHIEVLEGLTLREGPLPGMNYSRGYLLAVFIWQIECSYLSIFLLKDTDPITGAPLS